MADLAGSLSGGDCLGTEDICNSAFVSSSSSDGNPGDNSDSEPTDVSAALFCDDGIIDPGEECEPVSAEICNNGFDDDGDFAIDCADTDCTPEGFQSCDTSCLLTPACIPILNDPATLTSYDAEARARGKKGRVKIHGRFVPVTPVDPITEGFTFTLSNALGTIYTARLEPFDMEARNPSKMRFKDRNAKKARALRGGIGKLSIKRRRDGGYLGYSFKIKAYGNMSRATLARMSTQVRIGDDVAYLTADWSGHDGKWKLYQKDFK